MIQAVKQHACSDDLLLVITKIKALIRDRQLYQKINPTKDYVLCHGDFNPANITYDQASNHYFLIEWISPLKKRK